MILAWRSWKKSPFPDVFWTQLEIRIGSNTAHYDGRISGERDLAIDAPGLAGSDRIPAAGSRALKYRQNPHELRGDHLLEQPESALRRVHTPAAGPPYSIGMERYKE